MIGRDCLDAGDSIRRMIERGVRAGYERGYAAGLAAGVLREQRRKMDCRNASGCLYTLNQCAEVGYCIRAAPRAQAGSTDGKGVLGSLPGHTEGQKMPGPSTPIAAPDDDLVERLRAPDLSCSKGQRGDIHIEAADAIAALRAEVDTLVLISNCPQINNPCNGFDPTAVRIIVTREDQR